LSRVVHICCQLSAASPYLGQVFNWWSPDRTKLNRRIEINSFQSI
jgi:hypothetical protein